MEEGEWMDVTSELSDVGVSERVRVGFQNQSQYQIINISINININVRSKCEIIY